MNSISLRDQIAIAAMQGELASQEESHGSFWDCENALAKRAYEVADAMIAVSQNNQDVSKMLIAAIKRKHPDLQFMENTSVENLIFNLETGLPF